MLVTIQSKVDEIKSEVLESVSGGEIPVAQYMDKEGTLKLYVTRYYIEEWESYARTSSADKWSANVLNQPGVKRRTIARTRDRILEHVRGRQLLPGVPKWVGDSDET